MVKNRLVLIINFLEDLNENFVYGAGDVSAWSRSRLRDPGHQEPEPPKKVAAPQHCYQISNFSPRGQDPCCGSGMINSESGSSFEFSEFSQK